MKRPACFLAVCLMISLACFFATAAAAASSANEDQMSRECDGKDLFYGTKYRKALLCVKEHFRGSFSKKAILETFCATSDKKTPSKNFKMCSTDNKSPFIKKTL